MYDSLLQNETKTTRKVARGIMLVKLKARGRENTCRVSKITGSARLTSLRTLRQGCVASVKGPRAYEKATTTLAKNIFPVKEVVATCYFFDFALIKSVRNGGTSVWT